MWRRVCRCRANMEQVSQSRPDSGLSLSHFQYECLENRFRCSLNAAQGWGLGSANGGIERKRSRGISALTDAMAPLSDSPSPLTLPLPLPLSPPLCPALSHTHSLSQGCNGCMVTSTQLASISPAAQSSPSPPSPIFFGPPPPIFFRPPPPFSFDPPPPFSFAPPTPFFFCHLSLLFPFENWHALRRKSALPTNPPTLLTYLPTYRGTSLMRNSAFP